MPISPLQQLSTFEDEEELGGEDESVSTGTTPLRMATPQVDQAISNLRQSVAPTSPTGRASVGQLIDTFARRIPTLVPNLAEYGTERANVRGAEDRMNQFYQNLPIDQNNALLQMAAGYLKPPRSGSPLESAGTGIAGYAAAKAKEQEQRLQYGARGVESGYEAAHKGYADVGAREKIAMDALRDLGVLQRSETVAAVGRFKIVPQVGMVDTQSLDPVTNAPKVVIKSPAIQSIFAKYEGDLRKTLAREFAFQDPQALETEVASRMRDFRTRFESDPVTAIQGMFGQGAAPGAAPGPAPRPVAPTPAPGPAPAPTAAPAPVAGGKPWSQFITPPAVQPTGPVGKSTAGFQANVAGAKEAAKSGENVVEKYLTDVVYPGQQQAQGSMSNAVIAESILRRDPNLTGAGKEFMANVANWMTTLGIAPEAAKNLTTNMAIFKSGATLELLAKQIAQKGPQTESDARRMFEAGLTTSNPVEANRFIIRVMKAYAKRGLERSEFFSDWRDAHGGRMAGAVDAWHKYEKQEPMVTIINDKPYFWHELREFNASKQR